MKTARCRVALCMAVPLVQRSLAGVALFAIIPGSDYGFRGEESSNANARAG
jgi:hypothetical protein